MADFEQLIAGYGRFRSDGWARERDRWERLAKGQSPKVMVIACSDSRVDPSQVFDASPGEIFVVRNVAALVPPHATIPVLAGRMALGTWQSVVLVDTNADNPERQVRLSFLGG